MIEKEALNEEVNGRKANTREKEVNKCGCSLREYHRRLVQGEQVWVDLERIKRNLQWQVWQQEIRQSQQARDVRNIIREQGTQPVYLQAEGKGSKNGLATTARLRLGNEVRGYKYWMGEETLEHIFEKCKIIVKRMRNGKRW